MKMPARGWLTLVATVSAVAACSPPLPSQDASPEASTDAMIRVDVRTDVNNTPDRMEMPDVEVPEAGEDVVVTPDVEVPDAGPEAGMDAGVEAGMDAGADVVAMDAREAGADAATDVPVVPGCGLTVDGTLAIPAAGMTTTVMTTLNAMGTGGMIPSLGCISTAGGSERIYRLTVPTRTGVNVRASTMMAGTDLVMAIRRTCTSAVGEVACNDDSMGLNPAIRTVLEPGEYFVVVDELGDAASVSGGPVTVELTTFPLAPNAVCASPVALTTGMAATGSTMNGGSDVAPCGFGAGGQVYYSYSVPANSRASFAVRRTGMQNVLARVLDSCTATVCASNASTTATVDTVNVTGANTTGAPRTVILSVASTTPAMDGAFTITPTVTPLAPNADCSSPENLTGVTVMGNTASGATPATTCNSSNNGAQLFYSFTIPGNSSATFTATPTGMPAWSPYVRVFADCAMASTCLATSGAPSAGMPSTAVFDNRMATARTIVVSVGSSTTSNGGAFTLSGASMMLPAVPTNATCAMPQMLTLPAMGLTGTTAGAFEQRNSFTCAPSTSGGPLVYYSATVPAGRAMQFRVTPTTMTFDPAIRAFTGCMPTSCGDFRDSALAGQPEQMNYVNTSGADETVIFAVGSITVRQTGAFTVDASLLPAAATNTTCAMPRALTMGTTAAQLQNSATTLSTATCEAGATGAVLYYSLSVPAMTRAVVTATPFSDNADAVLRVRQDCATMACVTSNNRGFTGDPETVTVTNTTGAAVNYIVELGSDDPTTRGVFDLDVSFVSAAAAYTVVTLPMASCDDLSMTGTSLMISGDDATSPTTALQMGFSFRSFGDAMTPITHFSANTNGLAQLHANAMGVASSAYTNEILPLATAPTGALAVFWDDQEIDTTERPGAVVRYATLGTAPARRFVIEWNNMKFLSSSTATMRYQLRLIESSNIIEYHYCSMSSTSMTETRQTGTEAGIGMQNIARSRGQMYLHNGTDNGTMAGMPRSVGGGTVASPNLIRWIPL